METTSHADASRTGAVPVGPNSTSASSSTVARRIGRSLRGFVPGPGKLVTNRLALKHVPDVIEVSSPVFGRGQDIPARYSIDGAGVSPPIAWSGVPPEARSLVLIIEDPDTVLPYPLVHAIVAGIDPHLGALAEGAIPYRASAGKAGPLTIGRAGLGRAGYLPFAPPPGHGPHHYAFEMFALDATPRFEWAPGREYVVRTILPAMIARGTLFGTYER